MFLYFREGILQFFKEADIIFNKKIAQLEIYIKSHDKFSLNLKKLIELTRSWGKETEFLFLLVFTNPKVAQH